MKLFATICVLALGFVSTVFVSGQTARAVTPNMRTEAGAFYQSGDWPKAAQAYQKIVEIEDANVGARYRLGMSLLTDNKAADALPHLEKVMAAAPNSIFALSLAR